MGFLFVLGVVVLAVVLICHFSPRARTVLVTVVCLAVMHGWYKWRQATAEERQQAAEAQREAYLRSREHHEWQERDRRWQEEKAAALRLEAEQREAAERKAAAKKSKKAQRWKVWRLLGRSPVTPARAPGSGADSTQGSVGPYSDSGSAAGSVGGRHRYDNGEGVRGGRDESPAQGPSGLVAGGSAAPGGAARYDATQWGGGASVSSRDGTPLPAGGDSVTPAGVRRRHVTPFSAAGSHMSTPYTQGVQPSPSYRGNGFASHEPEGDGRGAGAGDDGTAGVQMPHFDDNAPGLADYDDDTGAGGLADYDDDARVYDDGTKGVHFVTSAESAHWRHGAASSGPGNGVPSVARGLDRMPASSRGDVGPGPHTAT